MAKPTIEESLKTTTDLMRGKASPFLVLQVLVSDGLELRQAETILRWAMLTVLKEKKK